MKTGKHMLELDWILKLSEDLLTPIYFVKLIRFLDLKYVLDFVVCWSALDEPVWFCRNMFFQIIEQ